MAKIISVDEYSINFEDGSRITYDHKQEDSEINYADFESVWNSVRGKDFDTEGMIFIDVYDCGFKFGNVDNMIFVPCYSDQTGEYSPSLTIYFNNEKVLSIECKIVY